METHRVRTLVSLGVLVFALGSYLPAQEQAANNGDNFTEEQQAQLLWPAKVMHDTKRAKWAAQPCRWTLTDATVTHDGRFQAIDETKQQMKFADGHVEFNFKDSYRYNVAGYEVAKLVGMDNMIPVTVERHWKGMKGSLSWWVPDVMMDELTRMQKHENSPDADAWNKQMYKVRVFDELVYDTDPNLTNVLITKDWKIWRIDFSRAFRTYKKLRNPENLVMCDKNLLEKMKALNEADLKTATKKELSGSEIKGVLARRDLIVETFNKLAAEKGEAAVFY